MSANSPKCPECQEELECDEVDIGVGVMKSPYYCLGCGWQEAQIWGNQISSSIADDEKILPFEILGGSS